MGGLRYNEGESFIVIRKDGAGMNFTPEQQSAIDAKNRELLVSAAAGSGKTAVLVRRILHLIRDEGYSIDRMLVVTYTRAAAAELRDRLETAMRDAALSDPAMAPSGGAGGAVPNFHHSFLLPEGHPGAFPFLPDRPAIPAGGRAHAAKPVPGCAGGNAGSPVHPRQNRGGAGSAASQAARKSSWYR